MKPRQYWVCGCFSRPAAGCLVLCRRSVLMFCRCEQLSGRYRSGLLRLFREGSSQSLVCVCHRRVCALRCASHGRSLFSRRWAKDRSKKCCDRRVCGSARRVLVLGVSTAVLYIAFGSPDAAFAYFRGDRLSVRPGLVDVGAAPSGEARTALVELVNRTSRRIHVIGGTSDCACVTTQDLPVQLDPGEAYKVNIAVRFGPAPGIFTRAAEFLTDGDRMYRVRFRVTGRTLAPHEGGTQGGVPDAQLDALWGGRLRLRGLGRSRRDRLFLQLRSAWAAADSKLHAIVL